MALSPRIPRVVGWLHSIKREEPPDGGVVYECTIKYKVLDVSYELKELINTNSFHEQDSVIVKYMKKDPRIASIRTLPDVLIDISILAFIFVLVVATFVRNWN